MSGGLSKATLESLERIVKDPNILVLDDGTVARRIAKPDSKGECYIGRSPATGHSIPAAYVVYRRLKGEIPNDKKVAFADGNKSNLHPDNLILIPRGQAYKRRGWKLLSLRDQLAIQKEYDGTQPKLYQLAVKYNVAQSEIIAHVSPEERKVNEH